MGTYFKRTRLCYVILSFAICLSLIDGVFLNPANATDPLGRSELEDTTRTIEIAKSIRDAIKKPDCRDAARILDSISEEKSVETSAGDKKCKVIKYTNKEISDAVVDMFLQTCNMKGKDDWFLDGDEPGWFNELQVYAESTFSSRLYPYEVFCYPLGTDTAGDGISRGRCMVEYLSNTNTSETLRIILNAHLNPPKHNAYLIYSPDKKLTHIELCDAMKIFSGICKSAPMSMRKESENVRAFIKQNIDHYVKNKTILPAGVTVIDVRGDFEARYAALDVLGFYANPADKDWIQRITDESLSVRNNETSEYFAAEKIKQKCRNVLEDSFKKKN